MSTSSYSKFDDLDPYTRVAVRESLVNAACTAIDDRCSKSVASFDAGPLYWLTNHTATEDPQAEQQGRPFRGPFPRKDYFVPMFEAFLNEPKLMVAKSRTMMTSLSSMGFATWAAQWRNWEVICQTKNLETAEHLMRMVECFYRNQPEYLKQRHPLSRQSMTHIVWQAGGSVMAIPSGADKIRAFHPALYVQDESAFLPEGEASLAAMMPTGARFICVSTAAPGWYEIECSQ